jgi:uncharacterized RDD family membrane protein YckC
VRSRARPDQAGFFRRFIAFVVDVFLITLVALPLYVVYSEIRGALGGEPGVVTQLKAGQPGQTWYLTIGLESQEHRSAKKAYLAYLRPFLSEEKYVQASKMSHEELRGAFREELGRPDAPIVTSGGFDFRIIQELLVGYLYFILFFRLGGRTPGKRLFGLKVVDLRGRPGLTWYQAFERTHGYSASLLVGGIGFLQVLWDKGGLTMHDKLAGTTVVRLPKRPRPKSRPAPAAPTL